MGGAGRVRRQVGDAVAHIAALIDEVESVQRQHALDALSEGLGQRLEAADRVHEGRRRDALGRFDGE